MTCPACASRTEVVKTVPMGDVTTPGGLDPVAVQGETIRRPTSWRRPDYGPNWDLISGAILARDGYRCQDPWHTKDSSRLVVHHITPLRDFAGDYLSANRPENLITVCKSCHRRCHRSMANEGRA